MAASDDNIQDMTTAASITSTCSLPSSSPTKNDHTAAVISINSSASAKNPDEKGASILQNELTDPSDQNLNAAREGTTMKEPEKNEQAQDHDHEQEQQKVCAEKDQKEITTTKNEEGKTVTETQNLEARDEEVDDDSSRAPQSTSTTQQNLEHDIEWLMPHASKSEEDGDNAVEIKEVDKKSNDKDSALKMLKKGAVAAVGGTMIGMGLVMIPLPTPFGAVVASSGLAVLGTEFDEAKQLNDRLIGGAKGHLNKARDAMVKGIEKMNEDEFDDDDSVSSDTKTVNRDDNSSEKEVRESGTVIKINTTTSIDNGNDADTDADDNKNEDGENGEGGSASESPPVWLHMNPVERKRQERIAKKKYRRDRQTTLEQAKEALTKRTGKFLSQNLLPFIKKLESSESDGISDNTSDIEKVENSQTNDNQENKNTERKDKAKDAFKRTGEFFSRPFLLFRKKSEPSLVEGQNARVNTSLALEKNDGDTNNNFVTEMGEYSQTAEHRINSKSEIKEEESHESSTIEIVDKDNEGYVLVS